MKENGSAAAARVTLYDWLRLVATIYVVLGHSTYLSIHTFYGGVDYTLPADLSPAYHSLLLTLYRYIPDYVYAFHMPLFFALSGAVLAIRPADRLGPFLRAKVRRLLIPYFLFGWLYMLPVKYAGGFYDPAGLKSACLGLLIGRDSGHLWFLPALFWCMLVFVLLQKGLRKLKLPGAPALLLVTGALQFGVTRLVAVDPLLLKTGLGYIFWFALGYAFELCVRKRLTPSRKLLLLAFALLTVFNGVSFKLHLLNSFFMILLGSVHTLLLSYLLLGAGERLVRTRGWEVLIRSLFSVYILHDPLEYLVLRFAFSHRVLQSGAGCYLYFGLRSVGIFALCVLLSELMRSIKRRVKRRAIKGV